MPNWVGPYVFVLASLRECMACIAHERSASAHFESSAGSATVVPLSQCSAWTPMCFCSMCTGPPLTRHNSTQHAADATLTEHCESAAVLHYAMLCCVPWQYTFLDANKDGVVTRWVSLWSQQLWHWYWIHIHSVSGLGVGVEGEGVVPGGRLGGDLCVTAVRQNLLDKWTCFNKAVKSP